MTRDAAIISSLVQIKHIRQVKSQKKLLLYFFSEFHG